MTNKSRNPESGPPPERKVEEDESALWQQVMEDVARLPKAERPPAPERKPPPKPAKAKPPRLKPTPVGPPAAPPPRKPPEPPLEHGQAAGLDKRTRLRLRRGQVEIQGVMDLHGHTQAEAHRALTGFLEGAQRAGKRSVLVVTGKGKGAGEGAGVLRAAVPRWLNEPNLRPMILAFSHAAPKDGGEGALYVLLKRKR